MRTIAGKGPVTIGDGTAGVGGGTFDELKIGFLKGSPVVGGNALALGGVGAWSVMGQVNIGEFVDNPATAADTGLGIAVMSPFSKISVGTLTCQKYRTVAHVVSFQASGKSWKTNNLQGRADTTSSVYQLSSGTVDDLFVGSGTFEGASANNGFLVYGGGGFAQNIHYSPPGRTTGSEPVLQRIVKWRHLEFLPVGRQDEHHGVGIRWRVCGYVQHLRDKLRRYQHGQQLRAVRECRADRALCCCPCWYLRSLSPMGACSPLAKMSYSV